MQVLLRPTMSAFGTKRTSRGRAPMSAFDPKRTSSGSGLLLCSLTQIPAVIASYFGVVPGLGEGNATTRFH